MSDTDTRGLLSLLRDSTSRAALEKFMTAHGVDPVTARAAAERCEKAALTNGSVGSAVGALLALFATSTAAGLGAPAGALLGLGIGMGGTLVFSNECSEVQDAAHRVLSLGN